MKHVARSASMISLATMEQRRYSLQGRHSLAKASGKRAAESSSLSKPWPFTASNVGGKHQAKHVGTPLPISDERCYVPVDASVAYHNRLQRGQYQSILELMHSPYAPPPLRVLEDVVQTLPERLSESIDVPIPLVVHVRHAFDKVGQHVSEATDAVELIGDQASVTALSVVLEQVEAFQQFIQDKLPAVVARVEEGSAALGVDFTGVVKRLEASVCEMLSQQLRLTSKLGLCEASVFNLAELRRHSGGSCVGEEDSCDHGFDLSDVASDQAEALNTTPRGVQAADHLNALKSCRIGQRFDVALPLYRQMASDAQARRIVLSENDMTDAVIALAEAVQGADELRELRQLLVSSDASAIPVSVRLYTSLIDAASRAKGDPNRMEFALALYRRLRDVQLMPSVETYSALIAVAASCAEPTHAFAFYREALLVSGNNPSSFPPALYTNFLMSYSAAKYYNDARSTLDVLIDAGAPLTRSAFHAVLDSAPSPREVTEIIDLMATKFDIAPTPRTFSFLLQAHMRLPNGVDTLLSLYDVHAKCLKYVSAVVAARSEQLQIPSDDPGNLVLTPAASYLVDHEAQYLNSLELACFTIKIDVAQDDRVLKYLKSVTQIPQARMNRFVGVAPQSPTVLPPRSNVAVLGPDVLSNVWELFVPSADYFSAIVVPYSSLLMLRRAAATRSTENKGEVRVTSLEASEHKDMVEQRRRSVASFIERYRNVIHVMSLEEEVAMSCETTRYGVGIQKLEAKSAVVALTLARGLGSATCVYKQHQCRLVLVTSKFDTCGRIVKDSKARLWERNGVEVDYWNPTVYPHWVPPQSNLAVSSLSRSTDGSPENDAEVSVPAQSEHSDLDAELLMNVLNEI